MEINNEQNHRHQVEKLIERETRRLKVVKTWNPELRL